MVETFTCPYFGAPVELTAERRRHIARLHPEVLPMHVGRVAETLRKPDAVVFREDPAPARLFVRWYDDADMGRNCVVAVVTDHGRPERHWIVTAHTRHKFPRGVIEWQRS